MKLFSPPPFDTLYEKKFSNLRPLLSLSFPQGFQKSKVCTLDFVNWGQKSLLKKPLKGVRNTNSKKILLSKAKFAQKLTYFARRFYTLY